MGGSIGPASSGGLRLALHVKKEEEITYELDVHLDSISNPINSHLNWTTDFQSLLWSFIHTSLLTPISGLRALLQ